VDGAACMDSNKEYISFIFGGPNDGSIRAVFKDLPSFIGSTANVKVEKVDWRNKDTPSNGPTTIFEKKYNISNGSITVDLSGCNGSSGYRIYITKGDGSSSGSAGQVEPSNPVQSLVTSGATYKLINRNSGLALGVENDSTANAANVIQWSDNGKTSQQWIITDEGDGYKLINVNSGKALDVNEHSTKDGANVIIWPDNAGANQRWIIEDLGDGYVLLENMNSGKNLDVDNGSMSDGGNVLQWGNNGGLNQQWKLVNLTPKATTTITSTATKPQTQPTSEAAECSAAILKQGYQCCPKGCHIEYTDNDGTWGIYNGEWCGCNASTAPASCPAAITSQGYQCCTANNCSVYETDESGSWGIENGEWCGISDSC